MGIQHGLFEDLGQEVEALACQELQQALSGREGLVSFLEAEQGLVRQRHQACLEAPRFAGRVIEQEFAVAVLLEHFLQLLHQLVLLNQVEQLGLS